MDDRNLVRNWLLALIAFLALLIIMVRALDAHDSLLTDTPPAYDGEYK